MGGVSYSRPALFNPNVPFFIMTFYYDQIQVFNADSNLIAMIRNILMAHYPNGIQKEANINDAILFKMKGFPFTTARPNDHTAFLNMCCVLLKELSQQGYIKLMSGDFNWYSSMSAWFFYKSPSKVAQDIEFCAIDLWSWDKLKLINCPPQVEDATKYLVYENWKGIQRAELEDGFFTLKMKGYPWQCGDNEDAVKNRLLIMKIVQMMATYGWTLYSATNIDTCTDTLFFCRKPNLYISPSFTTSIFAISLNRGDRLRLMNADSSVIEITRGVILQNWPEIQQEENHYGAYEFKMKGYPFYVSGEKSLPSVTLFCALLSVLRRVGWKVMMNLDISRLRSAKGVFFFVQMPPKESHFCALSIKSSSNIYGLHMTDQMHQCITQIIPTFFDLNAPPTPLGAAMGWQVSARPWATFGAARMNGNLMIAAFVNAMVGFNYHLCCSADVSSVFVHRDKGTDYKPDGDTLYFAFDDPPLNVGLFTDSPSYSPPSGFFSSSAPPLPPSYELLYST